ncbi:MAG: hypothetical protein ABSG68_08705 [Thermoguttaceae bacterium]|jgi:hypothetical protein
MKLAACVMAGLLAVVCLAPSANAALEKELNSVCLIANANARGTGTCFTTRGAVGVITAAHVAGSGNVTCQFVRNGYVSAPIAGQVVQSDKDLDVSLIVIPKAAFGGLLPTPIALGTAADLPKPGAIVDTVGCPAAAMPTGEKLHVIKYENCRIIYGPRPEHGRSGSSIFTADGTKIIGLICGFYGGSGMNDGGEGPRCDCIRQRFANVDWTHIAERVNAMSPQPVVWMVPENAECENCPNGLCPLGRLLNRNGSQGGNGGGAVNPWPQGAGDALNLQPILDALRAQSDVQGQILNHLSQPTPIASTVVPTAADAQTLQQISDAAKTAKDAETKATAAQKSADDAAKTAKEADTKAAAAQKSADDDKNLLAAGPIGQLIAQLQQTKNPQAQDAGNKLAAMSTAELVGLGLLALAVAFIGIHALKKHQFEKHLPMLGLGVGLLALIKKASGQPLLLDQMAKTMPALQPLDTGLNQLLNGLQAQMQSLQAQVSQAAPAPTHTTINLPGGSPAPSATP